MGPVPAGLADKDLATFLTDLRTAVMKLQQPGAPAQAYSTTSDKLPPAEGYKACVAALTDKKCIAVSTLVGSTWTWLRADGSAI